MLKVRWSNDAEIPNPKFINSDVKKKFIVYVCICKRSRMWKNPTNWVYWSETIIIGKNIRASQVLGQESRKKYDYLR